MLFSESEKEIPESRAEIIRDLNAHYDSCDRLGKALVQIAVRAAVRQDMPMVKAIFEVSHQPRNGGRPVNLDLAESMPAVANVCHGEELHWWVVAVDEILDLGDPDLLIALDTLARRRAAH